MKAAFSSLVLVLSVILMSSQKLARPCSASERPPQNQRSGATSSTITAVTLGSLCRTSAASAVALAAMATARFLSCRCGAAYFTWMRGMAVSPCSIGPVGGRGAPVRRRKVHSVVARVEGEVGGGGADGEHQQAGGEDQRDKEGIGAFRARLRAIGAGVQHGKCSVFRFRCPLCGPLALRRKTNTITMMMQKNCIINVSGCQRMSRVNLDMDVLRTLVTANELGALNRAAEQVGRSQSAVSQQIRKLEEQVGQPLFRKQGRGLVLTEA